jgi:hypothetical protein
VLARRVAAANDPIGDIEPSYSITSYADARKLGANAIPSAFAALEIDDDPKPHVQQRSPGVIFRFEALGWSTGPLQAFANWGNALAVQTRDRFDRFSREECPW